ncbi:unnamed protein product, partial [Brassica napus]
MRKHRFRETLKSFFEPHFDHEKDEMLKVTKSEIDEKVKKILGMVESGNIDEDKSKRQVVSELVNELHKEYQSLYDITGEIRKKVHEKGENSSSSSSDSDSDHSSRRETKKNGKVAKDDLKQQIETADHEIANLKNKLTTSVEEKEAVDSELEAALVKLK